MDRPVYTNHMRTSKSNGLHLQFSWYNVICGLIRSMLRATFQRYKVRQSSLESISNPSMITVEDSVEEVEELSPSEQFSWTRMGNVFSEYRTIHVAQGDELSTETIQITRRLFEHLLLEEDKYAEYVYDSIMKVDKTYAERFFHYSQLPKIRPREHMTRHLKKIIELHRLLLVAFEDDRTRAFQILNLVALSHILMNISIADFRVFDLAIGKFLYRMEMMDDTNVHHVVGYLATVTMHMERLLRRHNLENRKRELLLIDNPDYLVDINSVCRENYRELKKWHELQLILRKAVAEREDQHDAVSITKTLCVPQSGSATSVFTRIDSVDSAEMEGWLIEFLKRGYKYKERE